MATTRTLPPSPSPSLLCSLPLTLFHYPVPLTPFHPSHPLFLCIRGISPRSPLAGSRPAAAAAQPTGRARKHATVHRHETPLVYHKGVKCLVMYRLDPVERGLVPMAYAEPPTPAVRVRGGREAQGAPLSQRRAAYLLVCDSSRSWNRRIELRRILGIQQLGRDSHRGRHTHPPAVTCRGPAVSVCVSNRTARACAALIRSALQCRAHTVRARTCRLRRRRRRATPRASGVGVKHAGAQLRHTSSTCRDLRQTVHDQKNAKKTLMQRLSLIFLIVHAQCTPGTAAPPPPARAARSRGASRGAGHSQRPPGRPGGRSDCDSDCASQSSEARRAISPPSMGPPTAAQSSRGLPRNCTFAAL